MTSFYVFVIRIGSALQDCLDNMHLLRFRVVVYRNIEIGMGVYDLAMLYIIWHVIVYDVIVPRNLSPDHRRSFHR